MESEKRQNPHTPACGRQANVACGAPASNLLKRLLSAQRRPNWNTMVEPSFSIIVDVGGTSREILRSNVENPLRAVPTEGGRRSGSLGMNYSYQMVQF